MNRTEIYTLIDMIPESEIVSVTDYLKKLITKGNKNIFNAFDNAPYDDEPFDSESIKEAEKDIQEGRTRSLETVNREQIMEKAFEMIGKVSYKNLFEALEGEDFENC